MTTFGSTSDVLVRLALQKYGLILKRTLRLSNSVGRQRDLRRCTPDSLK
jgi:hypothetical protein